jgi:hypothetical protein
MSAKSRTLYVPAIGDRLELTAGWEFALHHERRNETLFAALGLKSQEWHYSRGTPPPTIVGLPTGTVLRVDRIYIRQGLNEFSSLSFFAEGLQADTTRERYEPVAVGPGVQPIPWNERKIIKTKAKRAVRFWAKLDDCNRIEFVPAAPKVKA